MILTDTWSGHSPHIDIIWQYDTDTKQASVSWETSNGFFMYYFFKLYVFFTNDVTQDQAHVEIGGMSGSGQNIWFDGSSSTIVNDAILSGKTYVAFGAYCSAETDGGTCGEHLGAGPTRITNYQKLQINSSTPRLSLHPDYIWTNGLTKKPTPKVSKDTNRLEVHWTTAGDTVKIKKVVCKIEQNNNSKNYMWVYPVDKPLVLNGDGETFGNFNLKDIKYNGKTLGRIIHNTSYKITVAVATETEDIKQKLATDSTSAVFRTRQEAPIITFTQKSFAGSSVKITWTGKFPTQNEYTSGYKTYMENLYYKLYDETTQKTITTKGVAWERPKDTTDPKYTGQFTIKGLTIGHKYTVTPYSGMTSKDGVKIGSGKGCTFTCASKPTIEAVYNMNDGSLVFGEPEGSESITVEIDGSPAGLESCKLNIYIPKEKTLSGTEDVYIVKDKDVKVGKNEVSLSLSALDTIYKNINPSDVITLNSIINFKVNTGGVSSTGTDDSTDTMTFKGNMRTAKVGTSNGIKRAKAWVGSTNGVPRRAIIWVGDSSNKPRRTI